MRIDPAFEVCLLVILPMIVVLKKYTLTPIKQHPESHETRLIYGGSTKRNCQALYNRYAKEAMGINHMYSVNVCTYFGIKRNQFLSF